MPTLKQIHLYIDQDAKKAFWRHCIQIGITLSEAGRLLIAAVLDGRIDLYALIEKNKETPDGPQSSDSTF